MAVLMVYCDYKGNHGTFKGSASLYRFGVSSPPPASARLQRVL